MKERAQLRTIQTNLQYEMQESLLELARKLKRLKRKHCRELKEWIKLKKQLRKERGWSENSQISAVRYGEPFPSPLLELRRLIVHQNSEDTNAEEETVV